MSNEETSLTPFRAIHVRFKAHPPTPPALMPLQSQIAIKTVVLNTINGKEYRSDRLSRLSIYIASPFVLCALPTRLKKWQPKN